METREEKFVRLGRDVRAAIAELGGAKIRREEAKAGLVAAEAALAAASEVAQAANERLMQAALALPAEPEPTPLPAPRSRGRAA